MFMTALKWAIPIRLGRMAGNWSHLQMQPEGGRLGKEETVSAGCLPSQMGPVRV